MSNQEAAKPPFVEPNREEIITYLREVMNAKIRHKPRVSDQLKAAELIAKLCGLNEPEKHLHSGSIELAIVIARMRGNPNTQSLPSPQQLLEISSPITPDTPDTPEEQSE